SRRRHTRSDRDWSSDVCSSDLVSTRIPQFREHRMQAVCSVDMRCMIRSRPLSCQSATMRYPAEHKALTRDKLVRDSASLAKSEEIGRASCRERVWKGVGGGW